MIQIDSSIKILKPEKYDYVVGVADAYKYIELLSNKEDWIFECCLPIERYAINEPGAIQLVCTRYFDGSAHSADINRYLHFYDFILINTDRDYMNVSYNFPYIMKDYIEEGV